MHLFKRVVPLLVLSTALLRGQSSVIDLRSHGSLELFLEGKWKVNSSEFGDRVIVNIEPSDETNASSTLTILFPEEDKYPTKSRLRQQVEIASRHYEEGSVEGKSVAREIATQAGFGFYCNFTDPELVGKSPQKGNYKIISVGMIHLAPDVLIEMSISADDFRGKPYQQILGALEGMEYKRRRLASASKAPAALPMELRSIAVASAGPDFFVRGVFADSVPRRNFIGEASSRLLPSAL